MTSRARDEGDGGGEGLDAMLGQTGNQT